MFKLARSLDGVAKQTRSDADAPVSVLCALRPVRVPGYPRGRATSATWLLACGRRTIGRLQLRSEERVGQAHHVEREVVLTNRHVIHQLFLEAQADQCGRRQAPLGACAGELLEEGICAR